MKPLPVFLILLTAVNIIVAEKKIIRDTDRFELVCTMKLPELNASGKLWIPLARTDPYQRFETLSIFSPIPCLADQLTRFQLEGADCAHRIACPLPDFRSFRRLYVYLL